jgi:hypothetical protein
MAGKKGTTTKRGDSTDILLSSIVKGLQNFLMDLKEVVESDHPYAVAEDLEEVISRLNNIVAKK